MKFIVRFKIGNRLSTKSKYSMRDICVCLVDRYSLKENEIFTIFTMKVGYVFQNEDMTIEKVK